MHWRITRSGPDGALIRDTRAAALFEKLEPGTYDVEAQLGLANARQTVEIAADTAIQVRINLNGGVLKMQARSTNSAAALPITHFHRHARQRRCGRDFGPAVGRARYAS